LAVFFAAITALFSYISPHRPDIAGGR
jgi:hypothetical protein